MIESEALFMADTSISAGFCIYIKEDLPKMIKIINKFDPM